MPEHRLPTHPTPPTAVASLGNGLSDPLDEFNRATRISTPIWERRQCIKLLSFPGDLVIDPFVGSGTTAVVAHGLGRRFWGCDRNPTAVTRAQARLEGTGNLRAS